MNSHLHTTKMEQTTTFSRTNLYRMNYGKAVGLPKYLETTEGMQDSTRQSLIDGLMITLIPYGLTEMLH